MGATTGDFKNKSGRWQAYYMVDPRVVTRLKAWTLPTENLDNNCKEAHE